MIALVEERGAQVGIAPLCAALGLARATFYRRRGGPPVAELRKGREFGPTTMIMTSAWRGGPCGSPQRRAGDSSPLRW